MRDKDGEIKRLNKHIAKLEVKLKGLVKNNRSKEKSVSRMREKIKLNVGCFKKIQKKEIHSMTDIGKKEVESKEVKKKKKKSFRDSNDFKRILDTLRDKASSVLDTYHRSSEKVKSSIE